MLSYRHGFHAGNMADVLKHTVLVSTLQYLIQKDKPLCYIDTHAGSGSYSLVDNFAQKNREFREGLGTLWQQSSLPQSLQAYVNLVRTVNDFPKLTTYPGSPCFAEKILRPTDRLVLFEQHSTEFANLSQQFVNDKRIKCYQEDGFSGLIRLLPPLEKRAVILIDPSYELKSDYEIVIETLKKAMQRFATGVYLIWYPILTANPTPRFIEKIQKISPKTIGIILEKTNQASLGLQGSGMMIINPPWMLLDDMKPALDFLVEHVVNDMKYRFIGEMCDQSRLHI